MPFLSPVLSSHPFHHAPSLCPSLVQDGVVSEHSCDGATSTGSVLLAKGALVSPSGSSSLYFEHSWTSVRHICHSNARAPSRSSCIGCTSMVRLHAAPSSPECVAGIEHALAKLTWSGAIEACRWPVLPAQDLLEQCRQKLSAGSWLSYGSASAACGLQIRRLCAEVQES